MGYDVVARPIFGYEATEEERESLYTLTDMFSCSYSHNVYFVALHKLDGLFIGRGILLVRGFFYRDRIIPTFKGEFIFSVAASFSEGQLWQLLFDIATTLANQLDIADVNICIGRATGWGNAHELGLFFSTEFLQKFGLGKVVEAYSGFCFLSELLIAENIGQ